MRPTTNQVTTAAAVALFIGAASGADTVNAFQTGTDEALGVETLEAIPAPVQGHASRAGGGGGDVPPVASALRSMAPPETESRPLGPAGASPSDRMGIELSQSADESSSSAEDWGGWARTVGALAIVLGLIFGMKLVLQRSAGAIGGLRNSLGAGGRAPSGVVFVLGRYPIARGHSLVLMKVDRRVLVLDQSSSGFRTLTEIVDAEEVASILVKTRDEEGESMASKFGEMLRSVERDPSFGEANDSPRSVRRAMSFEQDAPGAFDTPPMDADEAARAKLESQLRRIRGLTA
ncbi:MAG: flagellar biosynthetic protein FliO [Planctomycetota bacterium]